ncbi:FecR domain-containing protein [Myxococcus xanthus]|uniref:FecR domain-containing protein n=1 Tax=Myxococcus xanthus TaxID=34 RepID=UPI001F4561B6|nr:FecR domain-containing protein [Myxococcus xanthus]
MARHEHLSLWALAAGELDADASGRVETHVATCSECAQALEQVRQSRAVLHEGRGTVPAPRTDAMGEGLRAEAARRMVRSAPRARWPWAVALAGACAAMLASWMVRAPQAMDEGGAHVARGDAPSAPASGASVPSNGGDAAPTVPPAPETAAHATAGSEPSVPSNAAEKLDATTETERVAVAGAILREAGGTERALKPGMRLRSGVAVRTPARSSALLRLPDESRVRLSAGSEVELSRAESRDVHLTVNKGRLSVEASHTARQGFMVEVAGLRVSVVGTVFTVERTKDGAAVAVAEGQVRVEAEGQPPRLVGPGERVELHAAKHTLNPRKMSKPDLRAIAELRAPVDEVPVSPPRPISARPGSSQKPEPTDAPAPTTPGAVAAVMPTPGEPIGEAPAPEPAPPPATALAPVAAAGSPPAPVDPNHEFAPYPVPSVNVPRPPAPEPQPPPEAVAKQSPKQREPLIPMALVSKDADERFLGYARLKMNSRKCESFLVGLDEIAQRSPRASHREQARYLRARCFEEKLESHRAKDEYRRYLNDFPRGRYAKEAKTGLLP